MKNFKIICCVLAGVFGQIRSGAIEKHLCSSIKLENVVVNVTAIAGNYYGCVDGPNKPPASKQCTMLNLVPTSSNTWNSTLFSKLNKTSHGESYTFEGRIKNQTIDLAIDSTSRTLPGSTFTLIDTDNNDYLIYLGCQDEMEKGWISYLTKSPSLCSKYRSKLDEAIEKYGLSSIPLVTVNHDNCDEYKV